MSVYSASSRVERLRVQLGRAELRLRCARTPIQYSSAQRYLCNTQASLRNALIVLEQEKALACMRAQYGMQVRRRRRTRW